jgi:hypothetical protein
MTWSIPINDPEGNIFHWMIQCSNGQHVSANGSSNGKKSLALSGLAYSTTYKIWVNATDYTGSGQYTHRWYTFTTMAAPINYPPVFGTPSPTNSSTGNLLSLTWSLPINDPEGDAFFWSIRCSNNQTNSGNGSANGTKTLALSGLRYSTSYTVWVNAMDSHGSYTSRWYTFTTQQRPNLPPNTPYEPSGQTKGLINVKYTYTTMTIDPNGDQVYYKWDWGDGKQSNWLGPYDSNVIVSANHIWNEKGNYIIKVKAKDPSGAESSWSKPLHIKITQMLFSYHMTLLQLLQRLFERFPHAFPILRHLMGY